MPGKGLNVFLINDDIFSLNMGAQYLLNLDCSRVMVFENSIDCINSLSQNPDIIFIDYGRNLKAEINTLSEIKTINSDIPVFIVSENEDMLAIINTLKTSSLYYVLKTISNKERISSYKSRVISLYELFSKGVPKNINSNASLLEKILKKGS